MWISEVMLQQTRVEAVLPFYRRFLERFPTVESLASAAAEDVLAVWSGLGYYSRARNLHRTAKTIAAEGTPATYAQVLTLPGAGPYTAAAIASIALRLPHAAVDGNVVRVVSRLTNDASESGSPVARRRFGEEAQRLLDPRRPGDFNQAMMELGATVCVPRIPRCEACPVQAWCAARAAGTAADLPVKLKRQKTRKACLDLVLHQRGTRTFLVQRESSGRRLAEFWELPERRLFPDAKFSKLFTFHHRIVNDHYLVTIWGGRVTELPPGRWFDPVDFNAKPVSTVTKKALFSGKAGYTS